MKKLNIDGYIVHQDDKWLYDMFGVSSITQGDIRNFLEEADGEDVQLDIDCFGGDVWIASDIYSDLRAYKGKSTANVIGLSASASTIAMLGCNRVAASPTAQFMTHLASTGAEGNYHDMEDAAARLKVCDESIINAYEIKTGLDRETLSQLMEKTTWMTAQEAKNYGFIDEITLKEGEKLSDLQVTAVMAATNRVYNIASIKPETINALSKRFKNPITNEETASKGSILLPKTEEVPLNDNGEETQPVSDTKFTARDQYLETKYKHMEVLSK